MKYEIHYPRICFKIIWKFYFTYNIETKIFAISLKKK